MHWWVHQRGTDNKLGEAFLQVQDVIGGHFRCCIDGY